jgi:hypothetical protein
MALKNLFERKKLKTGAYQQQDHFALQSTGTGWPKDTWFQRRLRYVRQKQVNDEVDVISECPSETTQFRRPNGRTI